MEQLHKVCDALVKTHAKVSTIQIIIEGAPVPDADTRAALERLIDRYIEQLSCAATLVVGTGIWASALRAFLTSLQLVQRKRGKVKIKTFASTQEIASWVPPQHSADTGVLVTEAELSGVIAELLAHPSLRRAAS